jgi:hypothetical protein
MKTKSFLLLSLISLLIIGSCTKENDQQISNVRKPGSFKLIEIRNSKNLLNKSINDTNTSNFNFGNLKASKEFYFLLTNTGDEPIYDISLTSKNPAFTVSPSDISSIAGGLLFSNEENTGLIPMINIGVIHGIQLNGVGYTDLLAMGLNTSTLKITGKTLNNEDTIQISKSVSLTVNAKIMDIKLYTNSSEIDLTSPQGLSVPGFGGLGSIKYYIVNSSSTVSIKNIGNVPIDVHFSNTFNGFNNLISIPISDSISLPTLSGNDIWFELDGDGTITDENRLQLGNNGKSYFKIYKP